MPSQISAISLPPDATYSPFTGGVTPYEGGSTGLTNINPSLSFAANNEGDITSLDELLNSLNVQGQTAAQQAQIPNELGLETQATGDISSELSGQLPSDVLNLIQQQGAQRGISTGNPGSPNANASMLQALGLTSLGQEQAGITNLDSNLAVNPAAPLVDLTGLLSRGQLAPQTPATGGANLLGPTGSDGGSTPAPANNTPVANPGQAYLSNLFGTVTPTGGNQWNPATQNVVGAPPNPVQPGAPTIPGTVSPTNPNGTAYSGSTVSSPAQPAAGSPAWMPSTVATTTNADGITTIGNTPSASSSNTGSDYWSDFFGLPAGTPETTNPNGYGYIGAYTDNPFGTTDDSDTGNTATDLDLSGDSGVDNTGVNPVDSSGNSIDSNSDFFDPTDDSNTFIDQYGNLVDSNGDPISDGTSP